MKKNNPVFGVCSQIKLGLVCPVTTLALDLETKGYMRTSFWHMQKTKVLFAALLFLTFAFYIDCGYPLELLSIRAASMSIHNLCFEQKYQKF